MPRLVTRADLRLLVRERAGLRGSQPTDADLNRFINQAVAWAWEQFGTKGTGLTISRDTLTCTPGTETVALPADHAASDGVFRPTTGTTGNRRLASWISEVEFRTRYLDGDVIVERPGFYWYDPAALVLRPIPSVAEEILLVYQTAPPTLDDDADTIDAVFSADEPVIEYASALSVHDLRRREHHHAMAQATLDQHVRALRPRDRGVRRVGVRYRR